jgi:hypothetical protein
MYMDIVKYLASACRLSDVDDTTLVVDGVVGGERSSLENAVKVLRMCLRLDAFAVSDEQRNDAAGGSLATHYPFPTGISDNRHYDATNCLGTNAHFDAALVEGTPACLSPVP